MKLLGHESMTTSQRYVTAAGTETRSAAARNPLYAMLSNAHSDSTYGLQQTDGDCGFNGVFGLTR
jgi:hypothetical protein